MSWIGRFALGLYFASYLCSAQPQDQHRAEDILDRWSSRKAAREEIVRLIPTPDSVVASIAKDSSQPDIRRMHAISLLGTFGVANSSRSLGEISDDRDPKFRCAALQSLVELDGRGAIEQLIGKLDDRAVCLKMAMTDPGRIQDVFVSDEAVRLLEMVTGERFEQSSPGGHRLTAPWKDWWTTHKR